MENSAEILAFIGDLVTEWQNWLTVQKGHRPTGVKWYGYIATGFFGWLAATYRLKDLGTVSREDVEDWQKMLFFEKKNLANTSRANKLACVRSFFSWAVHAGHLAKNPSQGIPSPRSLEQLPEKFSVQELEMLFSGPDLTTHVGIRDHAMLRLLYAAGPRASELVNLDMGHIKDYGARGTDHNV